MFQLAPAASELVVKTRVLNQLYLEFNDRKVAANIDVYVMPFGAHCRTLTLVFDLRNEHVTFIDPDAHAGPALPTQKLNHMIRKFLNLITELNVVLDVQPIISPKMQSCEMEHADVVASPTRADSVVLFL